MPRLSRESDGLVQSVDRNSETFVIKIDDNSRLRSFEWNKKTQFFLDATLSNSRILRAGVSIRIRYRVPFFGKPFVTKVTMHRPVKKNSSLERSSRRP